MTTGNAGSLRTLVTSCPKDPAFRLDLIKSETEASTMTIVFSRDLTQAGMFNIEVGDEVRFKIGFRVTETPVADQALAYWVSNTMTHRIEKPQSKIVYPYEIFSGV